MTPLEAGAGLCRPVAMLSIRATRAVVEMGAVADVVHSALNAAHHLNRHGAPDDRLAVALPGIHLHRNFMRPGEEVVLFGSESALARFRALDGIERLARRGMLRSAEPLPVEALAGEQGVAFLRDRAVARYSAGPLRRAHERAARRGKAFSAATKQRQPGEAALALHYGPAVVHVRAQTAACTGEPVVVSTYGFSSPRAPAALPIQLDPPRAAMDDAA